ncbi:hypothetical protein CHUV0807_0034 [Cardiobacterium hominis]|uniref:Uncharacterized protein n=1 Tax=Cardiobacterium hominis TaxID=2718 RepID=A0A1C3H1M8_9GAMM|nr:hypothetical protein CHUV0807_0034 [Cardiobacterium hominis]
MKGAHCRQRPAARQRTLFSAPITFRSMLAAATPDRKNGGSPRFRRVMPR